MGEISHLAFIWTKFEVCAIRQPPIFPKHQFLSPKLFLVVGWHNVTVSVSKY